MKTIKSIIFISSVTSLLLASEISIDAQIRMIQQASPEQRYKLVNQLKEQISQMNVAQQARSIAKYREESLKIRQHTTTVNQLAIQERVRQQEVEKSIVPPIKQIPESKIKPIDIPKPDLSSHPSQDTPNKRPTPEKNLPKPPYHDTPSHDVTKNIPKPSHEEISKKNIPKPSYHDTPSHEQPQQSSTPLSVSQKPEQKISLPVTKPSSSSSPTNSTSHRRGF